MTTQPPPKDLSEHPDLVERPEMEMAKDGSEPIISVIGLHKSFGAKVVLDGIDFDIYPGERVVILGPSGTGKSVLLRHLVGLTQPDRGNVLVFGQDLDELPRPKLYELRLQIGVLFQGAALLDSMSVQDNVLLGLRKHSRLSDPELREHAEAMLTRVGLPGIGRQMPAQLSGGMRKRVGLARAIAMDPRIILYDEPTTGLDPVMADVINELIVQLAQPPVTSVVVTHDLTSAFKVGERFIMLVGGKILFDGNEEALRTSKDPRVAGFIAGRAETLDILT